MFFFFIFSLFFLYKIGEQEGRTGSARGREGWYQWEGESGGEGHWWLTPIILATQEAEIKRISVQSQLGQIVPKTLSQKNPSQKGLVEWLKV
jgi:hypothetical protein